VARDFSWFSYFEDRHVRRSNVLSLVIGVLLIAVAIMGYELYQDRKQPDGMRIDLGPNGVKIEKK
jgi:hypothetical protein